ncbi:hypothetical protein GOP47_0030174 [Adiantum capillus-veneris]|nr:hypothetical protein GOP47_0030174 [Adiantum capillus-veneris]
MGKKMKLPLDIAAGCRSPFFPRNLLSRSPCVLSILQAPVCKLIRNPSTAASASPAISKETVTNIFTLGGCLADFFMSLEKSNSGMPEKQPLATHGSTFSKGKSSVVGHNASSGQALQGGVRSPSFETHGKSYAKPSPHGSGNPSTSRLSSPNGNKFGSQDSESDDEKPLVFSKRPSPSVSMHPKDHSKNGITSSKLDAEIARKNSGNAREQSSHRSFEDDSDEDNAPLASRVTANNKRPLEISMPRGRMDDSDEDDDKPLVLKRPANGSSKHSKELISPKDSGSKKRPFDENLKDDSAGKRLKLIPKLSSKPTGSLGKPSSSLLKPPSGTRGLPSSSPNLAPKPSSTGLPKASPTASSTMSKHAATSKTSTEASKPPNGLPKASPTASSTMPKHSATSKTTTESSKPPKVSIASPNTSGTPTKSAIKMGTPNMSTGLTKPSSTPKDSTAKKEIDEDEDEVPLAQRISVPKVAKKVVPVKKIVSSLTTSVAARKLVEAKKARLKQQQRLMSKKVGKGGEMNAPGSGGGQKWTTLEHSGVIFPPPYNPHGIKIFYENKPVTLTPEQEEVATMFAVMRETDYVTKPKFLSNFWNDWKKILGSGHVIQKLEGCDFTPIYEWHLAEKEKKKNLPSEEKKRIKEEKQKQEEKYMWALVDGVKEKVGNFRVEPPGLFRGRGEHPKMGKLKRRIFPEDIVINIGKDAPIPECPMQGHRWKEIRNDNTVTWLAYWNDPINTKEFKYVFLAASSSLKGQSDKEKYEKARTLKDYIEDIRRTYTKNFNSADKTKRQIAVATYLIDRLALRAGNEKDDDEADTVGCCSLKVEHVTLVPPRSLEFDFLGKDSIRYFNTVEVEEQVFRAIGDFKKSKKNGQDLFDKLDTSKLNAHLKDIMPQLTAKVFRTYNASITLDRLLVDTDGQTVPEKIVSYQKANKEVAILCNHQRSVSKSHGAQMERLEGKMAELEDLLKELRVDLDRAKKGKPPLKDADGKPKRNQNPEALGKKIAQTQQKIAKMKLDMKTKDDLKTVALGTSKINYLDPRITVAWCKRHEVPIEKMFNKSLLAKFAWAMDVDMEYRF